MPTVRVNLGERSYSILIERGIIARLGELVRQTLPKVQRVLIITDSNVAAHWGAAAQASIGQAGLTWAMAVIPAGEESKNLMQVQKLYGACVEAGLERSSAIIALGGGVVGDMAGFVAATYLRGIPFVQVPTTLLSQADSSVGGKTGVDLPEGKNLVGAFYQPSLVVADPETLRTLPPREMASGMGEVVKHGVIRNCAFLDYLEAHAPAILALDPSIMEQVVEQNCLIKSEVVAADERESGLRAILNFGHTAGHAVETALGYGTWLHGECVAAGMVVATAISAQLGILQDAGLRNRLEALLERLGLPTRVPRELSADRLMALMQRDKKVSAGQIRWVLPVRAGEVTVTPAVPAEVVAAVLEALRG